MTTVTLESVTGAFAQWRAIKGVNHGRVPDALWHQVLQLIGHYKISHILKTLHLSYKQLKPRLSKQEKSTPSQIKHEPHVIKNKTLAPFVTINPMPVTPSSLTLEFVRSDGAIAKVTCSHAEELKQTLIWFLKG